MVKERRLPAVVDYERRLPLHSESFLVAVAKANCHAAVDVVAAVILMVVRKDKTAAARGKSDRAEGAARIVYRCWAVTKAPMLPLRHIRRSAPRPKFPVESPNKRSRHL